MSVYRVPIYQSTHYEPETDFALAIVGVTLGKSADDEQYREHSAEAIFGVLCRYLPIDSFGHLEDLFVKYSKAGKRERLDIIDSCYNQAKEYQS